MFRTVDVLSEHSNFVLFSCRFDRAMQNIVIPINRNVGIGQKHQVKLGH